MLNSTSFNCNCSTTEYFGPLCNFDRNQQVCLNTLCKGNSSCDPKVCDCNNLLCDVFMRPSRKQFMYHFVLWPLLGTMVTLLMVLLSIFVMKMKKARATHGTYSPSRHEQQASRIEFSMDLKRPPEERLI